MTDYLANGYLAPANPAITRDGEGFCYGSAIHPHDGMVWNLQEGLGSWTPEPGDDLVALSEAAASNIEIED